jgi:hypothetical protein
MALAIKMLHLTEQTTDDTMVPSFIHFKPKLQDWDRQTDSAVDRIPVYQMNNNLMLDTYMLNDILHYVEPKFLTSDIKEFFND